jgi:RHS repeat-associated protein
VVKRHDYEPFGEELFVGMGGRTTLQGYSSETDTLRQQFTGKERDAETGLDYFVARYYASAQGRFTSADTLLGSVGNPQTLNRYAYTVNNPLKYIDPTGHEFMDARFNGGGGSPDYDPSQLPERDRAEINRIKAVIFHNQVADADAAQAQYQHAQQNTVKYPPVKSSEVNVVYGGQQFEYVKSDVVDAIVDIANNQQCSDAFKAYNLTIPYDIVKSGELKVAGTATLYQANAQELLGWSAGQVGDAKALFEKENRIFFPSYTADLSYPGIPTVVFNPGQIRNERFGSLKDVVTHAFIHLGGQKGDLSASPHDLANFAGYKPILEACR